MSDGERANGVLRFLDDSPGAKGHWVWPDPTDEMTTEAAWRARYAPERLTREQAMRLASVADAYMHITTHPAGVERIIRQLRRVRALLRRLERADR
jgi:hypothetical protein